MKYKKVSTKFNSLLEEQHVSEELRTAIKTYLTNRQKLNEKLVSQYIVEDRFFVGEYSKLQNVHMVKALALWKEVKKEPLSILKTSMKNSKEEIVAAKIRFFLLKKIINIDIRKSNRKLREIRRNLTN